MEKLINIGTINGKPHYASLRVDRNCFSKIIHTELYSVRSGDMDYINQYGVIKCIRYQNFELMKIDMIAIYKNCIFTWDDIEYLEMLAN